MFASFLPVTAFAANYTDTQGHWGEKAIDRWTDYNIVNGKGNGIFDPDGFMTRAEAAQVFANLFNLKINADLSGYTDVGLGKWYDDAIAKCISAGIMEGYGDGIINPTGAITREMFFVMFCRALGIKPVDTAGININDAANISNYAKGYIIALVNKGYVSGTTASENGITVAPKLNINRASVMSLLDQTIDTYVNTTETVAAGDGLTLIVEDNAKVSFNEDAENAEVYVFGSNTLITKAPVGTVVTTSEDVTGTKVNGKSISKDATIVVKKTVPSGGGRHTPPTPAPTTYTVTFDLNGVGSAIDQQTIIKDGKATKPVDPADSAGVYTFAGWYIDSEYTTEWNFETDTVTADTIIYAKWTRTVQSILATAESDFPQLVSDIDLPGNDAWKASGTDSETGDPWTKLCCLTYDGSSLRFFFLDNCKDISKTASVSQDSNNYVYTDGTIRITFNMTDEVLSSIEYADTATDTWDGEYLPQSQCIAAGTMISMPEGKQKKVEDMEVGDVICTFDHETGEVSSAPVAFIWESKNVGNAFTLTFEGDVEVTVIEEHGFYDQKEQKYVFINLQNAQEYIGHHFYNADSNSWLELKSCEALDDRVDAYAIITSGDLNHMSNGMLSMCDGSVKVFANIFEYDDQMRFDSDKKKADIEAYGLTPKEKILELEGFTETDYDAYNLQYVDVMIGKGLITWEWMEALSDYCAANGL